jgi:hypothetical protein
MLVKPNSNRGASALLPAPPLRTTALPVSVQLWPVSKFPIVRYSNLAPVLGGIGELRLPESGGAPGEIWGSPSNMNLRFVRFIGCVVLRPRARIVMRVF